MSLRNLYLSARAAHAIMFGESVVTYTVPGADAVTWQTARPHRERTETRSSDNGTQRVVVRSIHVDDSEVDSIRADAKVTVDGTTYAVESHDTLSTGEHVVRVIRTLAAEVSRPRYRGNR